MREQRTAKHASAWHEVSGSKRRVGGLLSLALAALLAAGCTSEETVPNEPAQPTKIPFEATLAAPGESETRTVYEEAGDQINVSWKSGDRIGLSIDDFPVTSELKVLKVSSDGTASLTGDITITYDMNEDGTIDFTAKEGDAVTLEYPASTSTGDFKAQEGTLSYIAEKLDMISGTSTLTISAGKASLADKVQMKSGIGIWKLTLQDSESNPLSATRVSVRTPSGVWFGTTDITATSTVYLGFVPYKYGTMDNVYIEATVGGDTYVTAKKAITLEKGKYYQSTVKMTKE